MAPNMKLFKNGESLTTEFKRETTQFFKKKKIPFGPNQQKTLRLQNTNGIYTNLGFLFSDQSIRILIREAHPFTLPPGGRKAPRRLSP